MEQENIKKICIVIVSKDNDLDKVEITINNLRKNECNSEEIIVALRDCTNTENKEIIEFLNNNNLRFVKYEQLADVYYELPKNINFDYISFIEEGDTYSPNFKTKLLKRVSEDSYKLIICKITNSNVKYSLNKLLENRKENDIEKNPENIWVHLRSAFISKELLDMIKKDDSDNLRYYVEKIILSKLLLTNGSYGIARNIALISDKSLENSTESKIENYDLAWYNNLFEFGKKVIDFSNQNYGISLTFIQYMVMYIAKNVINENVNTKNKHIFVNQIREEFFNNFKNLLQNIDDSIIMGTQGNKRVNYCLLKLKYGKLETEDVKYREYPDKLKLVYENQVIAASEETNIKIILMDYVDGNLIIIGRYPFLFDENKLKIGVTYLDKKIYAKKNPLYSDYCAFGKKVYQNYTFEVKIPLKAKQDKQYIKFFLEGSKAFVPLDINFSDPLAKISKWKYSYWECGNFSINYRKKQLMVMKNSKKRHLKRELKAIISLLRSKEKTVKKAGFLRLLYNITQPFFKKEIWLFQDKIYKGGDNGEYLYTYTVKQKDDIKKYYILKEDCLDTQRFRKEGKKYVKFGSIKHQLLFLNANIVFITNTSVTKQNGFDENIEKYFRGLFKTTNICIQHGLSVQYIPHLINRIRDNLKIFYLASQVEKENMSSPEYAWNDNMDDLKITGCPRYDGLINNDKKQILITPTWRNYLALPSLGYGKSRRHNDNFKKSDYYKIYNLLINDKKLIETAKKTGYKIIYLLHPCTSPQIDDFEKNEYVELIAATDDLNYEKILTESSLMVTDYSGVQFDFAYMYKPVIYFHPDKLPASYDEGYYKYETMALGEITKTNQETVDLICDYMKNNCKIKDEYKARIDEFFKFHDHNNCKRIYEDVMKYRNREKNANK